MTRQGGAEDRTRMLSTFNTIVAILLAIIGITFGIERTLSSKYLTRIDYAVSVAEDRAEFYRTFATKVESEKAFGEICSRLDKQEVLMLEIVKHLGAAESVSR